MTSMLEGGVKVAPGPPVEGEPAADGTSTRGNNLSQPVTPRRGKKKSQDMTLRMKIFETFEDPSYSTFAKWYSIAMMLLIVLATACFVLESEAEIETGVLYNTSALIVFQYIEMISVILFSLEYGIRFVCCPCDNYGAIKFIIGPNNLIDLAACLPFWITLVIEQINPGSEGGGLGFVRVIRLIRIFRVFKFGRYSQGIQMFTGAIGKSTQPLSVLLFMLVLSVIILSSIMYMAEGKIGIIANDVNSTQYAAMNDLLYRTGVDGVTHLHCFGTIPRTFWWAVITMTTVGYGDCYPLTIFGKMLAMSTTVLGVLILALPITVIGSNFQKMVEMYEEESGMLHHFDTSEDGMIDEHELREFLLAKRKDNQLRKDVDLNPTRLMAKYDPQGNGTLSFAEFQSLKRDIIDPAAADPHANIRVLMKRSVDQAEHLKMLQEQLNRIERLVGGTPPPPEVAGAGRRKRDKADSKEATPVHSRIATPRAVPVEEGS